jgi:hypothetical protein
MPDLDAMIQAKLAAAADLLKLPGVTGVGVGHREKGGQVTDELAIRVYVEHKRPLNEVSAETRIPTEIGGFKTDVIEKGHDVITSLEDVYKRPIVGGVEITRVEPGLKNGYGSVCCFVTKRTKTGPNSYQLDSDVYMLSAAHVLEPSVGAVDDLVYQPRPILFGNLCARKADINWGNDAGLALLGRGIAWKNEICDVGPIGGFGDPVQGQVVRKQGRTTGLTTGRVSDISYEYINMDLGKRFSDLFRISPVNANESFALEGDSGGPVFSGGQDIRSNPPVLLGLVHSKSSNGSAGVSKIKNIFDFNVPLAPQEGTIQLSLAGRSGTQGRPNDVDRSVPMSLSYVGPNEIIANEDYNHIQGAWTATGENGPPYSFAIDPALPQGLSLSPEGIFMGLGPRSTFRTNLAPTVWKGNVTATDRTGQKSAPVGWELNILCKSTSIVVWPRSLTASPNELPPAVVGQFYVYELLATGGSAPYTFPSLELSMGLRLNSTGRISGYPLETGAINFTNFVRDARGYIANFGFMISIRQARS